jgi:hypothetical protein
MGLKMRATVLHNCIEDGSVEVRPVRKRLGWLVLFALFLPSILISTLPPRFSSLLIPQGSFFAVRLIIFIIALHSPLLLLWISFRRAPFERWILGKDGILYDRGRGDMVLLRWKEVAYVKYTAFQIGARGSGKKITIPLPLLSEEDRKLARRELHQFLSAEFDLPDPSGAKFRGCHDAKRLLTMIAVSLGWTALLAVPVVLAIYIYHMIALLKSLVIILVLWCTCLLDWAWRSYLGSEACYAAWRVRREAKTEGDGNGTETGTQLD